MLAELMTFAHRSIRPLLSVIAIGIWTWALVELGRGLAH